MDGPWSGRLAGVGSRSVAALYCMVLTTAIAPALTGHASATVRTEPGMPGVPQPATTLFLHEPAITLRTSVWPATYKKAGQILRFQYRVTNTGNVTLDRIGVEDYRRGLSAIVCPRTTLAPGQSMVCIATYRIKKRDIGAGLVRNRAYAQGNLPESEELVRSKLAVATAYFHVPVTG
jgi:hypothetical protein